MPDEPTAIGEQLARVEATLERRAATADERPPLARRTPEQEEASRLARRRDQAVAGWSNACPGRFHDARLDDLPDDPVTERLRAWAAGEWPWPNLVLGGATGAGKSHAACALGWHAAEQGHHVEFIPAVRMFRMLRPDGDLGAYARFVDADLLILDDLGTEKASDWSLSELYSIINDRWLDRMPTIVTTNLSADELLGVVGVGVFSRIIGNCATLVRVEGADRRRS